MRDNYKEKAGPLWKDPSLLATLKSLAEDPVVMEDSWDEGIRQRGKHMEVLEKLFVPIRSFFPTLALQSFQLLVGEEGFANLKDSQGDTFYVVGYSPTDISGQEHHKHFDIIVEGFIKKPGEKKSLQTWLRVGEEGLFDIQDFFVAAFISKKNSFFVNKASLKTLTMYKRYLIKGELAVAKHIKENRLSKRTSELSSIPNTNDILFYVDKKREELRKKLLKHRVDMKILLRCLKEIL